MKQFLITHIKISIHLVIIAITLTFGAWYAHTHLSSIEKALQIRLSSEEQLLIELATITDRNGVDILTETVIADCGRRGEFESYLNTLDTLTQSDLIKTQQLFENCGSFYSERKAMMVIKLERELDILSDFTILLQIVDSTAPVPNISVWKELVELEKNRSSLLSEQTVLQGKIISELITGSRVEAPEIQSLIIDAESISKSLNSLNTRIDEVRTYLSS